MPIVTIEYSNNIADAWKPTEFALLANKTLTQCIDTDLQSCKSKIIGHDQYCIADGATHNAFVMLTVEILSGRPEDTKQKLAQTLLAKLTDAFVHTSADIKLQISCYIKDIDRGHYYKHILKNE